MLKTMGVFSAALMILVAAQFPAGAVDTRALTVTDADRLIYTPDRTVFATGRPHLTYRYFVLDADQVRYHAATGQLEAEGGVVMDDGEMVMRGSSLQYDTRRQSGVIRDSRTTLLPWYFRAAETVRTGRRFDVEHVFMTTCDHPDPHYEIYATSATLYPNSRLVMRNLVFYAGRIPVFYWPIYTRLLRDPFARWHIRPGWNKREGTLVKISYDYDLPYNLSGSLYADYFQRRGIGTGLDVNWRPQGGHHYLYFYHIAEKPILYNDQTGKYYNPGLPRNDNWKLNLNAYQNFPDERVGLAYINYIKQNDFNNDYNEGLTNRVERTLESWAAFTQIRDPYTLRLSGEKDWNWNDDMQSFEVTHEELPKVNFHWNIHPLTERPRLYYQLDAAFARTLTADEDYQKLSSDAAFRVHDNIDVSRYSTLTLNAGVSEQWENRRSEEDMKDRTTARLLAGADYDHLLLPRLRGRLWYDYRRRLNNRVGMDFHGEERSQAAAGLYAYPWPGLQFHLVEGFDCRGETTANGFGARWEPLRGGFRWRPRTDLFFTGEAFYGWDQDRLIRITSENSWRATDRLNLNLNFYHLDNPAGENISDIEGGLGWTFGSDNQWRLNGFATWNYQGAKFKEETIILTRQIHCWEAHLIFADRSNGDREVWLLFNLTAYQQRKLGLYRNVDSNKFNMTGSAFSSLYQ